MDDENNEKKDIEVVEGIGNLDISPVYENLTIGKPQMQDEKPKNIVIPPVKKSIKKEETDDDIDDADEDETDDLIEINDILDFDDDADDMDDVDE